MAQLSQRGQRQARVITTTVPAANFRCITSHIAKARPRSYAGEQWLLPSAQCRPLRALRDVAEAIRSGRRRTLRAQY